MKLTSKNYYSKEANKEYWSSSQFKDFCKCEALGLATMKGEYERKETDALLIGSYVDAYFGDELKEFRDSHYGVMFKKDGSPYAKFEHADEIIERVEADPLMMEYLSGEKQVIRTAKLFGVDWKIKMDFLAPNRIVDLKCIKDFADVREEGYGYRSWIEYWGYDIQGAIYQKVEQISSGRAEPLPFYIAAVTKEAVPDIKVIQLPQHILDTALKLVEARIDRLDLVKMGAIEPHRCEKCDVCKATKVLTEPEIYEIREAM